MSATSRAKHASISRLTCSGSRRSARVVKPTMSAKSTVTTRRSSSVYDSVVHVGAGAAVSEVSGVPHWGQNRAPSGSGCEHTGHPISGERSGAV
jgi:hypothetical protein